MKTPAVILIVVGMVIVIWGAFGFQHVKKSSMLDRFTLAKRRDTTSLTAPWRGRLSLLVGWLS